MKAFARLVAQMHDGGRPASAVGGAGESTAIGRVAVTNASGSAGHLPALADLVVKGHLRAPIRRTYPLSDAASALQDFANEHTLGKLLITMS